MTNPFLSLLKNKTKLCQVGHCFVAVSVYKMYVQEMMMMMMMYGRR
jgi:hypothetical protein